MENSLVLALSFFCIALVGYRLLGHGLEIVGAPVQRRLLNWMSGSFLSGLLGRSLGMFFTLFSQVHLMYAVSFTASGIFKRRQALGYQAGFLASYLLTLVIADAAIQFDARVGILLGALLWLQIAFPTIRIFGLIISGLSLFSFGLHGFMQLLSQYFQTVNEVTVFHYMADNALSTQLSLLLGAAGLSVVLPSAAIALIAGFALKMASLISIENFVFLIGGQMLGEAILCWKTSFRLSRQARRISLRLMLYLLVSVLVVGLFSGIITAFSGNLAMLTAVVATWLLFAVLMAIDPMRWVQPELQKKEMQKLSFHHPLLRLSPTLGVEHIQNEVRKLAAMVQTILELTHETLKKNVDSGVQEKIAKYEGVTDNIQGEVRVYAAQITQASMSPRDASRVRKLVRITENLESVADHCRVVVTCLRGISIEDDERATLEECARSLEKLYELVFPDLTKSDILGGSCSDSEIKSLTTALDERQKVLRTGFPRLYDVLASYVQIASRLENICEARRTRATQNSN